MMNINRMRKLKSRHQQQSAEDEIFGGGDLEVLLTNVFWILDKQLRFDKQFTFCRVSTHIRWIWGVLFVPALAGSETELGQKWNVSRL